MTESYNQEELNKALNIYRRAMCDFIFEYLRRKVRGETAENLIRRIVNREPSNLEPKHISQIFSHRECRNLFKQQFGYSQLDDRDNYDIESVTALITMGRNIVYHHAGTTDLDSEFTRAYLFLIADILGEINKPDAKQAVESIRDRLFSNESEEHPLEAENAALKEDLADVTKQLEGAKAEKTELEKQVKDASGRLAEVEAEWLACEEHLETLSTQLKVAVAGKTVAEERLSDISNQLEEVERENAAYQKHIETISDQLEAAKTEKAKYEKTLKAASNQLTTLKRENARLEKRLETTSTQLEDVEEELEKVQEELAKRKPDFVIFQGTTFIKHLDKYLVKGDAITQSFWHYWRSLGPEGKEEMRDAGWSVEKVDDDYWEITVSPEDFEAWVEEDDEPLGPSTQLSSALTESIRPSYERTSLPTVKEMVQPALELFADRKEHRRVEMINLLTELFSLDDDERRDISRTGKVEKYLMKEGLIERTRTGYYQITTYGLELVNDAPF